MSVMVKEHPLRNDISGTIELPAVIGDWPYDAEAFVKPIDLPLQVIGSGDLCPSCGRPISLDGQCGCSD